MSFFRTIGAKVFASGAALALSALALSGCETQAFCFQDCGSGGTAGSGGAGGSGGQGGTGAFVGGQGGCGLFGCGGDGGGGSMCVPNGAEVCDGTDNDCDGTIDNVPGIDYANVQTCGTCSNNCVTVLGQQGANCSIAGITCQPSADPGNVPGTCVCTECASDYYDLNGDGICEYYCVKSADDDTLCNAKDDDCDGVADEDVDLCTSPTDCGKCGGNCSVVNGTGQCVASGGPPCDTSNTQCAIAACDPDWYDIDNSFATGCEYNCVQTNGGVEICGDGLDNDCDGLIDGADDLSGDPAVGVVCFGDPDGECAKPAHAGVTACVSNQVVCTGPDVLVQGQVAELCNNLDDDCDGATDDAPTDVGQSCGASNQAPCQFGTVQCLAGGVKQCVGNVDPVSETCDGLDNDCNGTIDDGNLPTIGDPCNVPIPPPNGATSACMGGVKACTGGVIDCVGDVLPVNGAADTCGVDQNCDGTLTNQPNTQSDVANCGACGNDCYAGSVHANWACVSGACVFQGCQQGYYDNGGPGDVLAGDNKCGYACTFVSAQEACNGQDDNCNGLTDDAIATVPQASQVCGTSGAAITAECKGTAQGGQIQISCVNGGWQCTFPAGVCAGGCSANDEICDTLDNDCDGLVNENVPNWNQPCASDDAAPGSHGVCKTTGTFVCNGANATQCSAVKASCAGLPGGCTEVCDGLDNDCDGTADDLYNGPASTKNDGFFVKPTVTKIGAALWIYTYEASRPSATNVVPGNGNGYTCTGAACVGVPSAPAGETLDKTKACSVANKIPWFNVTPIEVEQTCQAMGGSVCTTANFQTACTPNAACTFGYNPRGAAGSACATGFTASKFCNLGPSFDFSAAAGDQDGLLPTASGSLQNCWADWSGLQSNTAVTNKLYDLTGNLREITKQANNDYRLMGGAFDSASEAGAACGFTFYSVTSTYKYFDTGFRCCFTTDPTL